MATEATDKPTLWQRIDGYRHPIHGWKDGLLRATVWGDRSGWGATEALIEKLRETERRCEALERDVEILARALLEVREVREVHDRLKGSDL